MNNPNNEEQKNNILTEHLPFLIQNIYMLAQSNQKNEYISIYY